MFLVPLTRGSQDLARSFDRLFDDGVIDRVFGSGRADSALPGQRSPALDVAEAERSYTVKVDLPGIAKDGELLVSPADANMELRVQEVMDALRAGKEAQIAVPAKAWKSKLPLDGADLALDGVFEACL